MGKSTYIATNSELNLIGADGKLQLEKDQESAREYFQQHVNPSTRFFLNTGEKYRYMLEKNLYESEVFDRYNREDVIALNDYAFSLNHRFDSFMGARKFYNQYALLDHSGDSELDGPTYLERFEDRVVTTALSLADGDLKLAYEITDEIISGRYQPATPTFLNAGRTARGEQVSCFPAGTPIDTIEGQIDIDLIQAGDKVLSHDGKFHEVEEVIVNENTSRLVSVSHYGHMNPILCTPEHPILVWTDRDVETLIEGDGAEPDKGIVWLQAQDIDSDHDFILMTAPGDKSIDKVFRLIDFINEDGFVVAEDGFVRKLNRDKRLSHKFKYNQGTVSPKNEIHANDDLGLVLGWYVAEGHCSKRNKATATTYNGVHFTLGQHEEDFISELSTAFVRLFGVELKPSPSRNDGSIKLSCHSGIVARFLSSLVGSGFADKRITPEFLNFGDDFLRSFLFGLFRGDGCMTSGSLILDLVNPEIVDQVQLILLSQGIIARVRQYHNVAGNLTGHISIPGISGTNEHFIYETKKNLHNYAGLRGTVGTFYRSIHGRIAFGLREPVSVTKSRPEKVYNLHVADTHTYSVRGAIVHNCFLIRIEDSMESISRGHNAALQLSKRGGGVALLLTNLRELGAPIKGIPNAASGVVPVMKMLEDAFSYANQLGARQGAGAVYLNAHHPDILRFLDTKRENADEKVRIKTLSMGVVIPDITFELAKKNEVMYLFSPYDVERVYGVAMSDLSITEHYYDMIADDRIKKYQISARELFTTIAEIQFESGYPYILFEDTANKTNPIKGRINMSNLCVTGDTNILTADGYRNVKELFDSQEEFDVIVDTRARDMDLGNVGTSVEKSTPMFKTALNADVFKVTTSEGFELRATEWHKMYVVRDGELVKIALADVVVGDKLLVQTAEGNFDVDTDLATVTAITADGTEAVYDVTVDNGNSVIFNGIATGNCSEILQTNTPSTYNDDLSYDEIGQDISCNLGSLNIAKAMESPNFAKTVEVAIRALTAVTDQTSIDSVPSIRKANEEGRSIGLGQMNLHGFFGRERIHYGSPESVEFTSVYFAMVAYHALKASNMIAIERGDAFSDFADSAYADGSYFDKYVNQDWVPESDTVKNVFDKYGVDIPTREDWQQLKESVMEFGIYHRYLQAVPPTGSISYINGSTSSIHPIASRIEIRKESKVGRVYYPAAYMTNDNLEFYRDAYEIGPEKIIDVYAAASEHVDQGLSLTLFYPDTATTRDLNKYWIYAWRTGKIKTLYYARIRQAALEGTQSDSCVSCTL